MPIVYVVQFTWAQLDLPSSKKISLPRGGGWFNQHIYMCACPQIRYIRSTFRQVTIISISEDFYFQKSVGLGNKFMNVHVHVFAGVEWYDDGTGTSTQHSFSLATDSSCTQQQGRHSGGRSCKWYYYILTFIPENLVIYTVEPHLSGHLLPNWLSG